MAGGKGGEVRLEELIERAERGEVVGDGSQQLSLLVEQKRWAFDRLRILQAEQTAFREPERTIVCNVLANGKARP